MKTLAELQAEPEFSGSAADNLEMLVSISGRCLIAGIEYPAPTMGYLAVLEAIHSPFLRAGAEISSVDVVNALKLLSMGRNAVPVALEYAAACIDTGDADAPAFSMENIGGTLQTDVDLAVAAMDLARVLNMATGLAMLPETAKKTGEYHQNMDSMTSTITMLAEVIPSVSPDDVAWKYPLPMIGFLVMQSCRKKGMKGICRHDKSRALWDAFKRESGKS